MGGVPPQSCVQKPEFGSVAPDRVQGDIIWLQSCAGWALGNRWTGRSEDWVQCPEWCQLPRPTPPAQLPPLWGSLWTSPSPWGLGLVCTGSS